MDEHGAVNERNGILVAADWHQAYSRCHAIATALPAESVPLDSAVGRTLAVDLIALCDVPHYASSAMDGWAVAGPRPWSLTDSSELADGQASPIVTGGLVPGGAYSVVRSEHGIVTDGTPRPWISCPMLRLGPHSRAGTSGRSERKYSGLRSSSVPALC